MAAPCVYRHYAESGELLYVGFSINVYQRTKAHRSTAKWWREVKAIHVEHFGTTEAALSAEKAAIKAYAPKYNVAHTNKPKKVKEPEPLAAFHPIAPMEYWSAAELKAFKRTKRSHITIQWYKSARIVDIANAFNLEINTVLYIRECTK